MTLVNFVTFIVLKILNNLFSRQNLLNSNNCWRSQISKTVSRDLTFLILNVLFEFSIHFSVFNISWKKKWIFTENEAVLLSVTMRERMHRNNAYPKSSS